MLLKRAMSLCSRPETKAFRGRTDSRTQGNVHHDCVREGERASLQTNDAASQFYKFSFDFIIQCSPSTSPSTPSTSTSASPPNAPVHFPLLFCESYHNDTGFDGRFVDNDNVSRPFRLPPSFASSPKEAVTFKLNCLALLTDRVISKELMALILECLEVSV
jgi:hypothetical protein